ncbi:MAG: TonB-dependent receptor plug domain-containing protein, partial [Pseudomonadota bacterium]
MPAHAQELTDVDQNITPLGRIVLGWGTEQVALDTPQATTVVDQTDIERQQATTVGELLQGVPGVTTIGSERPAGQAFNIRGFGEVPAGDEGRVVIQQNGATKFYEQYRLGAFFADPAAFCNIEVLRGPASATLYGGGAIGGVIRFETCQASDILEDGDDSQLRLTFGLESNAPGGQVRALYAARPSNDVEFLISGGYRTAEDYEDGDGDTVEGSAFDSTNLLASGTYYIDDTQRLTFTFEAWNSDLDDTALDQTNGLFDTFGTTDRRTTDITVTAGYDADLSFGDLELTASYSDTQVEQSEADAG